MTTFFLLNVTAVVSVTTTSPSAGYTTPETPTAGVHGYTTDLSGDEGCADDVTDCPNVTEVTTAPSPQVLALCRRLAPPPVPPWLRDRPSRLYQLTRHCKSWTRYHELCNSGSGNSTWGFPRPGETTDEVTEAELPTIQWVIPALALVVVLLVLLLALVLYKYYSRPTKKRMYRVAGGSTYRFKPPHGGLVSSGSAGPSSWTGGPLVESETTDSYLSQPAHGEGPPSLGFGRSPVCRLLEQTQYVATPTEDQHRPRPTGPPAFASPAYFLPALSWLRLPALRQAWPNDAGGGGTSNRERKMYSAAGARCKCGSETTHHWSEIDAIALHGGRGQGLWAEESRTEGEDPEYSEIPEGDQDPPHYSSLLPVLPHKCLTHPSVSSLNGLGPYEYELQERANGHALQEAVGQQPRPSPQCHHHQHQRLQHQPPRRQHHLYVSSSPSQTASPRINGLGGRGEHRYEKLWQCGDGDCESGDGGSMDVNGCPSSPSTNPGTIENGWLFRYRLPSPCVGPASGQLLLRERCPGRDRTAQWASEEATRVDDLTSDSELLPCECGSGAEPALAVPSADWGYVLAPPIPVSGDERTEVKYTNPMFEGRGGGLAPVNPEYTPPFFSRLWTYMGLTRKT